MRTRLLHVSLLCALAACSATGQKQSAATADADGPLAVVNGAPITEAELGIQGELIQLQQQAYQVRMGALEEAINEKLIAAEAEKRGVTAEELVETEIAAKIEDPTDLEIEAFYEQQKARIQAPLEQVRPQVAMVLRQIRERGAREEFVSGLRESYDVQIHLDPPRLPVDLSEAPILGPEDAPITIVEFSDFQCPFCRRVQPTLTQLKEKYGDKIRWSFKDLPLKSIHPQAQKAAEAARCAGDQGKFWEYRAAMFDANAINSGLFDATAEELALDNETFQACLSSDKYAAQVDADLEEASGMGLTGTPAFLINGVLLSGALPYEEFEKVIERELDRAE